MIDQLVSLALLGTRGAALQLPPLPDDITQLLGQTKSAEPDAQLLDALAAATLYARCGAKPRANVACPSRCPPDERPECSMRAADILAQILHSGPRELLPEWLDLARGAGRRPAHRLLPPLLEVGTAQRTVRTPITDVIGQRGRWLMQFNPRWQYASSSDAIPTEVWHTGNRQQRAELLRSLRAEEPGQARNMIQSTWKDDTADERAEWLGQLIVRLDAADEDFLESCLDDRSSRVREASADLLARLPDSAFVRRMTQRVEPLVAFTHGAAGNLLKLKRGTKARLDVRLPESFDKSMQRDGMSEKPGESLGPKQWWLLQMLGCVPLAYWRQQFNVPAETIVEAAPAEFAAVLVRGWLLALSRRPEPAWIAQLLKASGVDMPLESHVLQAIPDSMRADVLGQISRKPSQAAAQLSALIGAWRPLAEDVSRRVMECYDLALLLGLDAFFHLHPKTLPELESRLAKCPEDVHFRKKVDTALSVIALRQELHKEFGQ